MKKINFLILFFGVAMIALSGCSLSKVNLVRKGVVAIESVPTKEAYFKGVKAFDEQGEFVLSGAVKSQESSPPLENAHVHIVIVSPSGEELERITTEYAPPVVSGENPKGSLFTARLDSIPPKGSKITLNIHKVDNVVVPNLWDVN